MLSPNTLLQNRYRIKRVIARGGMGMVYEAEAVHLGRTLVAVKETFFEETLLREQFEREAAVLARLRHPALPKVTDHFSEGAGQFLVMEFIPGDDLEKLLRLRGEPFEWRQVVEWADRLLEALDYIHTQDRPVIHRDIKPSNLKLTPRGELMLLDFGLAKNATTPTRQSGSVHGYTLAFAPPEQINGTGTDMRCDLYSLGATLYNLLTNEMPIDAKLRAEMMAVPMPDPLRPAHLVNLQIPMPLSVVLARAMAVDREKRYPTAAAMRAALQQARQTIEEDLREEQRRKEEAESLLAEQQRLAEETRQRAATEAERKQKEEAERRQKEKVETERKLRAEAERKQREETERQRKLKEEAERKQREARDRELIQQRRRVAPAGIRPEPITIPKPAPAPRSNNRGKLLAISAAAFLSLILGGYWSWSVSHSGGSQPQIGTGPTLTPTPIRILAPNPSSNRSFEFETITLDRNGKQVERRKLQTRYFTEDLGNGVTLEMVAIPGGRFQMGSPSSEAYHSGDEGPQHSVNVSSFWMGKYEVTQAQWQAVMGNNPSSFKGDANLPVESVSWNDAQEFLKKLNSRPNLQGKRYRLPSEAEWEYAARAGATTPFAFGETITPEIVNYNGKHPYANAENGVFREKTVPVGSLGFANAFGLFDMHGNVWEWCEDYWHPNYSGAPIDGSAWLSGGDSSPRVLRGGSWYNYGLYCRSANRDYYPPDLDLVSIGLRVVVGARTP